MSSKKTSQFLHTINNFFRKRLSSSQVGSLRITIAKMFESNARHFSGDEALVIGMQYVLVRFKKGEMACLAHRPSILC